jgi:transcriptional regulator with XRE-family HTH domain
MKKLKNPRAACAVDKHFGKVLREARKAKKLTQTTLAEQAGISFQQIQKYEAGSNRISPARLIKLSNILEVGILKFYQDAPGYVAR